MLMKNLTQVIHGKEKVGDVHKLALKIKNRKAESSRRCTERRKYGMIDLLIRKMIYGNI
jgi:hypothetical protein